MSNDRVGDLFRSGTITVWNIDRCHFISFRRVAEQQRDAFDYLIVIWPTRYVFPASRQVPITMGTLGRFTCGNRAGQRLGGFGGLREPIIVFVGIEQTA